MNDILAMAARRAAPGEGDGKAFDLSILVPVVDEEANIEPVLGELFEVLDGFGEIEVIFVDDGSTDRTHALLTQARERYPGLRVLRHRRNAGKSAALRTGVRAARAPWVLTLDGDGQNDPTDIRRMVAARDSVEPGLDVRLVAGIRCRRKDTRLKQFSSRVANGVRSRVLKDGVRDTACGFKLVEREAFLRLPYFEHMHRFLPALILRDGGRVLAVDIDDRPRMGGTSKYGFHNRLWAGIADMLGVLWLQRRPVRSVTQDGV